MSQGDFAGISFVLAFMLSLIFALVFGYHLLLIRHQAIERGHALHCPDNGDWAWVGECEG